MVGGASQPTGLHALPRAEAEVSQDHVSVIIPRLRTVELTVPDHHLKKLRVNLQSVKVLILLLKTLNIVVLFSFKFL